MNAEQVKHDQAPRIKLFPLYFLAFTGDFLLSTMIVACSLVADAPEWAIGLLGSAFYISYTPSAAILGRIGDRIGRRTSIMITSTGFFCVSFLFMLGSENILALFIGELCVGFLNGFYWPNIEAYISENAASESEHQGNVNKFCLSWSIGYMIGPFIAPVLDDIGPLYSFMILAILSSINIVNTAMFVPKRTARINVTKHDESKTPNQKMDRGVILMVLVLALSIFTYNFARAFIVGVFPDIAKSPAYFGWTGLETGIVLFCFGAARSVTFVIQNRIKNDALSARVVLSLLLSLCSFLFITTQDLALFCLFFAITGVLSALVYSMTLQSMLHLPAGRGQAAGLFESGLSLGGLLSPVFSGIALGLFRVYEAAFIMVGTVSVITSLVALMLLILSRKQKKTLFLV
nr:MFS transporter [Candidatus Sigynarchaeota archaeon]